MADALNNQNLDSADEPGGLIFEVDASIEFSKRGGGAQTHYVAHDPRLGSYFRLGVAEYHATTLLDGKRPLAEVRDQLARDGVAWTLEDLLYFVRELAKHRVARVSASDPTDTSAPETPSQQPSAGTPLTALLKVSSSILSQRIPVADGDRIASRLLPMLGPLFTRPATICASLFICSGIAVVSLASDEFGAEVRRVFDQPIWLFGLIWLVLKLVHECGHAVCARHHGVRVGRMGVMFFLLAPLAYVDVTDAWKLVRRRDRIQIALAGVYLELILGATAAWIWWLSPVGAAKHFAAQVFLVAGPATLLVNANPLLRLDGYYVLSDLLEIPNLRQNGRERLRGLIEWVLFSIPAAKSKLPGWRADFALLHALCSVAFQVVWMTGLIVALGRLMEGLGILLAVTASIVWCVIPLVRWMHKIWTYQPAGRWRLSFSQRRLLALCALVAVMGQYLTLRNSPFARRVPVVVRFQNEQIARAPVDSFVDAVLVECGERVKRGRLLVVLSQPELNVKRSRWIDQRDLEFSKAIQYRRRREIALADAATQKALSLDRRIAEVSEQIQSLRIVAARDGIVSSPAIDRLLGHYLKSGDEVIRVSDPHEKELLAVVAESDVESYRAAVNAGSVVSRAVPRWGHAGCGASPVTAVSESSATA